MMSQTSKMILSPSLLMFFQTAESSLHGNVGQIHVKSTSFQTKNVQEALLVLYPPEHLTYKTDRVLESRAHAELPFVRKLDTCSVLNSMKGLSVTNCKYRMEQYFPYAQTILPKTLPSGGTDIVGDMRLSNCTHCMSSGCTFEMLTETSSNTSILVSLAPQKARQCHLQCLEFGHVLQTVQCMQWHSIVAFSFKVTMRQSMDTNFK